MDRCLHTYILFNLIWICIDAAPKYPVDISFLVSDFKYSQKDGLKICEVQHGALSAVGGDLYITGGDGRIPPLIAHFFAQFPLRKWAAGLLYPPLKRCLAATGWDSEQSLRTLTKNPLFLACATAPPVDPFCIRSYAAIVYADFDLIKNFHAYRMDYPGIIFTNAATFPSWKDKYKMNMLFDRHDELKQYKADWRLYRKKYDPLLADKIQQAMPAECYVIKPRHEVLANGVIVVAKNDLDSVLQMILEPVISLRQHPDKKYAYWWNNKDDTFLIEKYYASDYVSIPLPVSEKESCEALYHYDATMRLAFMLQHDQGMMTYHCLGGFWKLPAKALEEEGTLNEKSISCCRAPFYQAVDQPLLEEVNAQMERAMLLLYEIMLYEQDE